MKVSFVYPPKQSMGKLFYPAKVWKNYSESAVILPNLGIAYCAALLRENGHEVDLIEGHALDLTLEEIVDRISSFKPEYLLYTSITDNIQDTLWWIKEIRQKYDKPVVIGGPHVGVYPRETLSYDFIDYAVIGDGWETLPELMNALEKNKSLSAVKSIGFKKGKEVIITEPRPQNITLEDVPYPARDLLPNHKYDTVLSKARPVTSMITNLGCPFKCTYCCTDRNLRVSSPEHVVAEIEECIKKYGIREIEFYDETFTLNAKRMARFLDLLEEKKLNFLWSCRTSVRCVTEEMLARMAKLGCNRVSLGIEVGNEKILKEIRKPITNDMVRDGVRWAKKAGITVLGFFILGLPNETEETIADTINLSLELNLDYVEFNKFVPVPNSQIYEEFKKDTGIDFWREYTLGKATFEDLKPYKLNMSLERLNELQVNAYRSFYFRPKSILKKFIAVRSFSELYRLATAAKSLI
jgi:anaerobic magnesium-protoporphyrin IX monomethyl ester cyclase